MRCSLARSGRSIPPCREVDLGGRTGGVRRQPDDAVGHRGDEEGHGDATAVAGHLEGCPSTDADLGGGCGREAGDCGVSGAGEVRLAVLQGSAVEEQAPGRQNGLAGPGRRVRRPTRIDVTAQRERPPRASSSAELAPYVLEASSWMGEPSSSARMTARARRRGPATRARRRTDGRDPPSRGTSRPSRPPAATGNTTSACSVTAVGRSSRLTTKRAACGWRPVPARGREGRPGRRRRRPAHRGCHAAVSSEDRRRCRGQASRGERRPPRPQPRRPEPRHRRRGGHRGRVGQRTGLDSAPLARTPGNPGESGTGGCGQAQRSAESHRRRRPGAPRRAVTAPGDAATRRPRLPLSSRCWTCDAGSRGPLASRTGTVGQQRRRRSW